jgi:hypothetical protein
VRLGDVARIKAGSTRMYRNNELVDERDVAS